MVEKGDNDGPSVEDIERRSEDGGLFFSAHGDGYRAFSGPVSRSAE